MSKVGSNVVLLTGDDVKEALTDDRERAQTLYFNWLCVLVHADDYMGKEWYILAKTLHDIEFYWTISNDDNRATDGVKLREVWLTSLKNEAEDLGVGLYVPVDALNGPCTMLEMMVGLASRIESDIMQEDSEGNRTWQWFWYMVGNLLRDDNRKVTNWWWKACPDDAILPDKIDVIRERVRICLDREYKSNGTGGGLFPLDHDCSDRREIELWYQAQEWIKDYLELLYLC